MKLLLGSVWAAKNFYSSSRPDNATMVMWILKGIVQGRVIDNVAYIFPDQKLNTPQRPEKAQPKPVKKDDAYYKELARTLLAD